MKRAYIDITEGQIHYRVDGSGRPLLLLHQTASHSDEYSLIIPVLAESCRVIAMDTMGYGLSDSPPVVFQIEDYARTVKEFLAALGIGRASLLGHHTGASIAVEVAAAYPELVGRLILSGCPSYEPEERKERMARYHPMQMTEDGSYILEIWNRLKTYSPDAGAENWHRSLVPRLMAGPRGEEAHHAVFQYDEKRRLPLIKSPTLLISGTKDTFYNKLEATSRLIPNCTTRAIENAQSLVALTMPDKFAGAILEFLKDTGD